MVVSRHTVVCQRPRKQKRHAAHKCGIYWYRKVAKISLLYLKNYQVNFYQIYIYILSYIYTTSHINFEGNRFLRYLFLPNFLHIFLLRTKLQIHLSRIKITFPCFDFSKIWNTYKAHWGLHFSKVLKNSKKTWGSYVCTMILLFFHNLSLQLPDASSMLWIWKFSQHYSAIKSGPFLRIFKLK